MTKSTKTILKWAATLAVGLALSRWNMPPALRGMFHASFEMKVALVFWLIFAMYWSASAKDSASSEVSESKWSRRMHLVLVNVAVLLLILQVPGLTQRFVPAIPAVAYLGLTIEALSVGLAVAARRKLGRNWSGEVRIATEHQLVCSGPYRVIRHPIYTAVLGMYCGTMLVSGQIHAPLALLLVTAAYWRKIRLEERALTEAFGTEYSAYQQKSWALVPFVI